MKVNISYFLIILSLILSTNSFSQNKLPYPIIFIHGLAGSETTFGESMEYLRDEYDLGDINVFDICLNADNESETALMSEDVKWEDFIYDDETINIGRRNYEDDIDDYIHEWTESSIFAINFKEENFDGANGVFNDLFDQSNQAAIYKQGFALNKMIQEVLDYTGAEKVILVGHSMGGLCIREYLQRTDENNIHINWIDPTSPDGHKVARVATFGTPHLGSNTSPDPTKSDTPDESGNSEANRDLIWKYDSYNFCDTYPQGIYMFGGNENCIASEGGVFGNSTFDNVDINCNGSQTDDIVGINESPTSHRDNPNMPLPLNIKYTYMTSIWIDWSSDLIGDGAVDIHKQWLYDENNIPVPYNITDTLLTDVVHTSEGDEYTTLIRGIDEPKLFSLAYNLDLNQEVIGFTTYQQNRVDLDEDVFKISCGDNPYIGFVYEGELSGVHTLEFYDLNENLISSKSINSAIDTSFISVPTNSQAFFVKLIGTATETSWENPYKIHAYPEEISNINTSTTDIYASLYPNPSNGNFTIIISDDDLYQIEVFNKQSKLVYKGNIKRKSNLDFSFLKPGIYTIKLISKKNIISKKLVVLTQNL